MKKVSEVQFRGEILSCKSNDLVAQQLDENCEILLVEGGSISGKKGDYLVKTEGGKHYVIAKNIFEAIMNIEVPVKVEQEVGEKSNDGSEGEKVAPVVEETAKHEVTGNGSEATSTSNGDAEMTITNNSEEKTEEVRN